MLINIMDLLEAEVDKEVAKKKAAQNSPGFAETAGNSTAGTPIAEDINQGTTEANGGDDA